MNSLKLLVLLACCVAACSKSNFTPIPSDGLILAFGDSLTVGVGAGAEQSYPSVLSTLIQRTVINGGISGETSAQGLVRFPQSLDQYQPNLVILLEGGNDILRNISRSSTKDNLAAMISLARAQKIPVLLLGVPEKKLFSDSAPLYDQLAEEFDLLFLEDLVAELLRTPSLKSDPVHLNGEGYKAMAEGIYEYMLDQGLL